MRTQRLHKPSKRALENMETALERENSVKRRRNSSRKSPKMKKPQRKQQQSTFAEFIDTVHEVQKLTHPSKSQGAPQYLSNSKPLKLQRQMRLIDLDVQSSSSNDDNDTVIFDEFSSFDHTSSDDFITHRNLQIPHINTHSRSSSESESSIFDRNWTKFHHEISLLNTQTGSDRVDNIINQYQTDNNMILGYDLFYHGDDDTKEGIIVDEDQIVDDESYSDALNTNETTIIDDDDLYLRNSKLPSLHLKQFRKSIQQEQQLSNNETALISPTSSFNMLATGKYEVATISRDNSLNSITSTTVNMPSSPNLDIEQEEGDGLLNPSRLQDDDESLLKYINIDYSTNQSTGSPVTQPKFSFDYRHNTDSCLNLKVEKSLAKPPALTNRAIWKGGETEMFTEETELGKI